MSAEGRVTQRPITVTETFGDKSAQCRRTLEQTRASIVCRFAMTITSLRHAGLKLRRSYVGGHELPNKRLQRYAGSASLHRRG